VREKSTYLEVMAKCAWSRKMNSGWRKGGGALEGRPFPLYTVTVAIYCHEI
jgi:hypothetical protein